MSDGTECAGNCRAGARAQGGGALILSWASPDVATDLRTRRGPQWGRHTVKPSNLDLCTRSRIRLAAINLSLEVGHQFVLRGRICLLALNADTRMPTINIRTCQY